MPPGPIPPARTLQAAWGISRLGCRLTWCRRHSGRLLDATGPLAAGLESSGELPMTLLKFCSNVQCISVMRLLMRCHTYTTVALLWCDAVSSLQQDSTDGA